MQDSVPVLRKHIKEASMADLRVRAWNGEEFASVVGISCYFLTFQTIIIADLKTLSLEGKLM